MNFHTVFNGIGKLLILAAGTMLIPLGIALFEHRENFHPDIPEISGFLFAILISLTAGIILILIFRRDLRSQTVREGFTIVTFGWIALAFVGSIPLFIWFISHPAGENSYLSHFTNAYFETMSGFTTTGATILTDIETVPRSLLFWRALTHWLGGMGIVTLALALFPALGISGYQMFKGEVPGPTADRLRPRLAETARILWQVYFLFTGVEALLLWLGGMSLFDAITHAFATMATGGFSTKNASIAAYNNDFIHWVITFFMFLAGVNFLIHFRVLQGNTIDLKKNPEFRFYIVTLSAAILLVTFSIYHSGPLDYAEASKQYRPATAMDSQALEAHIEAEGKKIGGLYNAFKHASFQVVALTTTTGFCSADFDIWPAFSRMLLLVLMLFGGSAGSTGGGIKMIRILTTFKWAYRELKKISQPRLIQPIKIGGHAMEEFRVNMIIGFVLLFFMFFVFLSMIMTLFIPDILTAATSVIASLANIGPGLGGVGAIENYNWIPTGGKWVLIFAMLLGRLEIFTVLVVLRFSNWKR
jgi:trk system potassium uptake protein